jgi:DhnA family fructose-bisphosphate aldolase class Ia
VFTHDYWYGYSSGKIVRWRWNAVVVAIDHGLYNGPVSGLNALPETVHQIHGADAILLSPGVVAHVGHEFARRGAPMMMIRLNWGTQYLSQWNHHESHSIRVLSPSEAVALGADIVLVGMSIRTGSETIDAENVAVVARAVSEKRAAGAPIVGEVHPAGYDDLPPTGRHEQIAAGCRVVAELGVDIIKTYYTGERFAEIVAATPIPILALTGR